MGVLRRARALRRELLAAERVPYTAQLSNTVVRTSLLDYVQVFRCAGVSFESADDAQLNSWHERLNILWRNIASPNVALWSHVIRRRAAAPWQGSAVDGFAAALLDKYRERLAREVLMVNELYLSLVYRPAAGVAAGLMAKALSGSRRELPQQDTEAALEACAKLAQTVSASLARYEPQLLGSYEHGTTRYSAPLEFLGMLINGEWQRMPLTRTPLNQALVSSRLFFGGEVIEYRTPHLTRAAAMLGIKEYPTPTTVGMYNRAAVRALRLCADAVIRLPVEGDRPGSAAAADAPARQRRGLCRVPGTGAATGARRIDKQ
jgi:type IV secretion system protein VirB4